MVIKTKLYYQLFDDILAMLIKRLQLISDRLDIHYLYHYYYGGKASQERNPMTLPLNITLPSIIILRIAEPTAIYIHTSAWSGKGRRSRMTRSWVSGRGQDQDRVLNYQKTLDINHASLCLVLEPFTVFLIKVGESSSPVQQSSPVVQSSDWIHPFSEYIMEASLF